MCVNRVSLSGKSRVLRLGKILTYFENFRGVWEKVWQFKSFTRS